MLANAIVFQIQFREIAATLEHDPEKASPGPDPGGNPVFGKDQKALAQLGGG
jgi:hypothetical protein